MVLGGGAWRTEGRPRPRGGLSQPCRKSWIVLTPYATTRSPHTIAEKVMPVRAPRVPWRQVSRSGPEALPLVQAAIRDRAGCRSVRERGPRGQTAPARPFPEPAVAHTSRPKTRPWMASTERPLPAGAASSWPPWRSRYRWRSSSSSAQEGARRVRRDDPDHARGPRTHARRRRPSRPPAHRRRARVLRARAARATPPLGGRGGAYAGDGRSFARRKRLCATGSRSVGCARTPRGASSAHGRPSRDAT
jgi:hypothetical protein